MEGKPKDSEIVFCAGMLAEAGSDEIMTAGKKFAGARPYPEVIELAKKKGWLVNTDKFDNEGSDYITLIDDKNGHIIVYNTFNATFIVSDQNHEIIATEESPELDNEPWYAELLEMFFMGELVQKPIPELAKESKKIMSKYEREGCTKLGDIPEGEDKERLRGLLRAMRIKVDF